MLIIQHPFLPQTIAGELVQTADLLLGQQVGSGPHSVVDFAVAATSLAVVAAQGGTVAAPHSAGSGILR